MKPLAAVIVVLCTSFLNSRHAFAQADSVARQEYTPVYFKDYVARTSVEIDPVAFLFEGYSFHFRYKPMFSEHVLLGLGTYALNLPDQFVDMNPDNRDMGWAVRIRNAYFLYGELYQKEANDGWFVGEQIGFQRFRASRGGESGESASFNNLTLMTYLGYSWHPYKGSFYVKPWLGLGLTEQIDGNTRAGSKEYDVARLFPFFTFHIGYTF